MDETGNDARAAGRSSRRRRAAWLTGPLCLVAAVAAALLVRRGPGAAFAATAGVLVAACLSWIVTSVFLPAYPDRTCPRCGEERLVRRDRASTRGVRCTACGFEDASASSFTMAEEEGALEPLVLRERGRRGRPEARVAGPEQDE